MKNSGIRILVVEDETVVAEDIQSRLRKMGYEADWVVANGEQAVQVALKASPHVILVDVQLGDGIDGIETVARIQASKDVPVVYLTAYSDETSLTRAKLTGPYGYIVKPVDTIELRITIELALLRHSMQSQLNEVNRCLSTTLASIGEAVIASDEFGRVKIANREAGLLIGVDESSLVGQPIDQVFRIRSADTPVSATKVLDPVGPLLSGKSKRVAFADVFFSRKDGAELPVDVLATLISDGRGEPDGIVLVFRDVSARQLAEADMRFRAFHDSLTGLPNRSSFYERLGAAISQSTRHSRKLALLFLDLDDFKTVNDSYGHDAGDSLLQQLAGRLKSAVRAEDVVARLAGDEFIIVLSDVEQTSDIEEIASKILSSFDKKFKLGKAEIIVTASIGISLFPSHGSEVESLIRYADTAMYLAKQKGKNAFAIYAAEWKHELPV